MYFPQASQGLDKSTIKLTGLSLRDLKKQGVETTCTIMER